MSETIEYRGFTIRIEQDDYYESPREWDNLSLMWCWHRRYNLGDEKPYWAEHWFDDNYSENPGADLLAEIEREYRPVVIEPIGMLDHSGLYIYKGHGHHWSDPGGWDSGAIGWAFVPRDAALKEYGCKYITKRIRDLCQRVVDGEIEVYSQFHRGDVWGYIITDPHGEEPDDNSCWGFYGYDYCVKEAKELVDYYAPEYEAEAEALLDAPVGPYAVMA